MHGDGSVSGRSLLEPFRVGVAVIDGLGESVSGHISYDGYHGLTLDLATVVYTADAEYNASAPESIERAIGVLETGECATLKNLVRTKHRVSCRKRSAFTSSYTITEMFVGDGVFDTKCDLISVKFKGLVEWMNQRPLKMSFDETSDKLTVEYTNPHIPEVALDDGTTLEIAFGYAEEHNLVPAEKFTLPQSTSVNMRTKAPSSFDALYYKALRFNRLVMLVTNAFMPLTSIQVEADGDLFGVFGKHRAYGAASRIDYLDFNSHYTDVRPDFAGMVNGWFALYGRHNASLDWYFDTWAQTGRLSLDMQFLRTVQSLEAFDKERNPGRTPSGKRPKACYKKNRQDRPALGRRLESLLEIPYRTLETGATKEEFVEYVTQTRNNYSHGDIQDPENPRRYAVDLAKNTKRLELLMHGNVVHELPIPDHVKDEIMASKVLQLDEFASAIE